MNADMRMKANIRMAVIVILTAVFLTALTVGGTVAYMTDGGSMVNEFAMGSVPETTVEAVAPPAAYTVTFDPNGGDSAPASQSKTQGEALELSWELPARIGYMFVGWADSSTAVAAQFLPGDSYTADADAVLYALWSV